jgi:hypothetical protein
MIFYQEQYALCVTQQSNAVSYKNSIPGRLRDQTLADWPAECYDFQLEFQPADFKISWLIWNFSWKISWLIVKSAG